MQRSAADQIKRAVGEQDSLLHVVFVYTEVMLGYNLWINACSIGEIPLTYYAVGPSIL